MVCKPRIFMCLFLGGMFTFGGAILIYLAAKKAQRTEMTPGSYTSMIAIGTIFIVFINSLLFRERNGSF